MLVCWVLLGNVLIISPIKECFKRPFKECLAMFVYTQHTRSVHTAYTQCSVYTQRTHSAHTLMGHSESPSEYAVCICCVYAVCTLSFFYSVHTVQCIHTAYTQCTHSDGTFRISIRRRCVFMLCVRCVYAVCTLCVCCVYTVCTLSNLTAGHFGTTGS